MGMTSDPTQLQSSVNELDQLWKDWSTQAPTTAKPVSKDVLKQLKELSDYIDLHPDVDPYLVGAQVGLSKQQVELALPKGRANTTYPDSLSRLPKDPPIKDSAALVKIRADRETAIANNEGSLSNSLNRSAALGRVLAETGAGGGQIGGGFVNAVKRFADANLEYVGIDVINGSQTDINILDAGTVDDIAEISQVWKGAISDFENKLFSTTAAGTDKSPEFIRHKLTRKIMMGASEKIRYAMASQMGIVKGDTILPGSPSMNGDTVKMAVEYIKDKYKLPDPNAYPVGSEQAQEAAKVWAEFASNSSNLMAIRGAILMANYTKGIGSMDDPEAIKGFISQGALEDGYNGVTLSGSNPTPVTDESMNKIKNDTSNPNATVTNTFTDQAAAQKYLSTLPDDKWPATIIINGESFDVGKNP